MKPIREKLTKTVLLAHLSETAGMGKGIIATVLSALEETMIASIKGCGEFTLPGIIKIATKVKPAVKKGTRVKGFGGIESISPGKPARTVVKVRPLAKLKGAVA